MTVAWFSIHSFHVEIYELLSIYLGVQFIWGIKHSSGQDGMFFMYHHFLTRQDHGMKTADGDDPGKESPAGVPE